MKNLVTAQDITTLTAASLNVEPRKLEVSIPDAQQRYLRPLIGVTLLAALLAFVADAPEPPALTGLSAEEADTATTAYAAELGTWRTANAGALLTLWDQVKPMLAQWALVEAWPNLLVHIEDAGVVLKTGNAQGTTTADAKTLDRVLAAYYDTAVWRGEELVAWLESKKADYPAYVSTTPTATGRQPDSWFGGINIG